MRGGGRGGKRGGDGNERKGKREGEDRRGREGNSSTQHGGLCRDTVSQGSWYHSKKTPMENLFRAKAPPSSAYCQVNK